jgi:RNA polymerase sigma factor (sigma-70 family)
MDGDHDAQRGSPLEREADYLEILARSLARGDPESARDLAQDTRLAALRAGPNSLRDPRRWLTTVMKRLWTSRLRGLPSRRTSEIDEAALPGVPPADDVARAETAERLKRAVDALSEPYRTVLHMRYWQGLEPREIAAALERPRATVFTQLHRGLALLREDLDRQSGGDRERWLPALLAFAPPRAPRPHAATPRVLRSSFGWSIAALALIVCGAWWLTPVGGPSAELVAVAENVPPVPAAAAAEQDAVAATVVVEPDAAGERVAAAPAGEARADLERAVDARVVSESGEPVEDVELFVARAGERLLRAKTGADGRARVEVLEEDLGTTTEPQWRDHAWLVAMGPGAAFSDIAVVRLREPRIVPLDIQLFTELVDVRGLLVEAGSNRPIRGAKVSARRGGQSSLVDGSTVWLGLSRVSISAADGSFSFTVAPGSFEIKVEIDGVERVSNTYDTGGKTELRMELQLQAGGELSGTVLGLDGWPLAGARVRCRPDRIRLQETTCAEDGTFRLRGLELGKLRFEAQSASDPELVATAEIEIEAGAISGWTAQLERRVGLRLRVVDPAGEPVAGAYVFVASEDPSSTWRARTATDAEGRVAHYDQPEGPFFVYVFRDAAGEPVPRRVLHDLRAQPDEHVIVVERGPAPGGSIAGAVLAADGRPLENGTLILTPVAMRLSILLQAGVSDGSFRTAHLPAGGYRILARKSGQGWTIFGPFAVEAGLDLDVGPLRLPSPGHLVVDWRLSDPELGRYQVDRLDEQNGMQFLGVSSDRGLPAAVGPQTLLPGPYRLRFFVRPGLQEEQVVWIESGRETRVVVGPEPLVVVHVRLTGLGGDAKLQAIDAAGKVVREERPEIAADGRAQLWTELTPGTWTLRATDLHGASAEAKIELDPRRPIRSVELEAR